MAERERIGLDNLSPPDGSKKTSRRVGRGHGSGAGKTSGRGHKGQKSRSGATARAWFEGGQMPLYRRTPKRGFKNPGRQEWSIVNLADLDRVEGDVNPVTLAEHGLISTLKYPVKVLARGEAGRAMTVRAHAFSAAAKEKIEAAGGTVQVIEQG
jgi:large subunit ribosomal protein L15